MPPQYSREEAPIQSCGSGFSEGIPDEMRRVQAWERKKVTEINGVFYGVRTHIGSSFVILMTV